MFPAWIGGFIFKIFSPSLQHVTVEGSCDEGMPSAKVESLTQYSIRSSSGYRITDWSMCHKDDLVLTGSLSLSSLLFQNLGVLKRLRLDTIATESLETRNLAVTYDVLPPQKLLSLTGE